MGFSSSGPFRDLEEFLESVSEQFEGMEQRRGGQPRVDIEDTGEEFVVTADLPGFDKDDIGVEIRGDTISIDAEHDDERKQELSDSYVRRERRHTSVSRELTLPEPVDETQSNASYENSVLRIELPKARQETGTQVEIE